MTTKMMNASAPTRPGDLARGDACQRLWVVIADTPCMRFRTSVKSVCAAAGTQTGRKTERQVPPVRPVRHTATRLSPLRRGARPGVDARGSLRVLRAFLLIETGEKQEGKRVTKHDLLIAASTIWVVVTAVLVMFMQAGFAFLEARPDADEERRPHRGQERADLRDLLDRLLGGRLRHRVRRRRLAGSGRMASSPRSPSSPRWARLRSTGSREIPGAAGYLFEVVFAGVSLAIVWGAMAERASLGHFASGYGSRLRTRSSPTGSGARTAGSSGDAEGGSACRTSPA